MPLSLSLSHTHTHTHTHTYPKTELVISELLFTLLSHNVNLLCTVNNYYHRAALFTVPPGDGQRQLKRVVWHA